MYKIGELSRLCRLSVKTLRYYADEGLLMPDLIDQFTGYRYYSPSKLADCNRIIVLKELGFSLNEIREQLHAVSAEDTVSFINKKQEELFALLKKTEAQIKALDIMKKIITERENKMFDIVIRNADTLRIASIRKIFRTKEEAYAEADAMKKCLPQHILGQRTLIINYESEYKESNFDLAACVEITGKLPANSAFEEQQITFSDKVAVLVCPKEELENAYQIMTEQLNETPAQVIGAYYEFYHEDGTVELKVSICQLSCTDDKHKNDNRELTFENDADVIGAWEWLDTVPSREQFSLANRKYEGFNTIWLKKLYFLPEGKGYWIVDGWTKNSLFTSFNYPAHRYCHHYTIEKIGGETLLFLEMKDYWHEVRGGKPIIFVYRKLDDHAYTKDELRRRDNVDLPFVPDKAVFGKWRAIDYVCDKNTFDPSSSYWKEDLFFKDIIFREDGKADVHYGEEPYTLDYTNGLLLDKRMEFAHAYETAVIDGVEYLFIEWKNGDYAFGGRKPDSYVFLRIP